MLATAFSCVLQFTTIQRRKHRNCCLNLLECVKLEQYLNVLQDRTFAKVNNRTRFRAVSVGVRFTEKIGFVGSANKMILDSN